MRVDHIEHYIDEQSSYMEFIASSVNNLTSVGISNVSSHRVETRRNALKEAWSKFSVKHDAIRIAMRQLGTRDKRHLLKNAYFKENMFKATQEGYLEALEAMSSMMERLQKDTRSPSICAGSQASSFPTMYNYGPRLPQLTLPTFDGSPSEWIQFKDLFDSMVLSNSTLTPVWKLHYLKQSLKGTASHLLKNTTLTNDNFQKAWDALVSFYENKRLLVNSALHSLLTLKRITKESSVEIESLYSSVTQIFRSLETLGRPVSLWDDFLVFVTAQKLDTESIKLWEQKLGPSQEPPTWQKFLEFLLERLLTLKAVEKSRRTGASPPQYSAKAHVSSEDQTFTNTCIICSSDHYTSKCPEYSGKTVPEKREIIQKHKLCFNCLGQHRVSDCRSPRRCLKCGSKHHTTIHTSNDSSQAKTSTSDSTVQVNLASKNQTSSPSETLLATIQVIVSSENGDKMKVRALVDPGSQISFISEKVVQSLKLSRQHSLTCLRGIGGVKAGRTRGEVSVNLVPHFKSPTKCNIRAHILPKLTAHFSFTNTELSSWSHLKNLQFADPNFHLPGEIDIIIGANYYGRILEEGLRRGPVDSPTAQATSFGWILFGPSESPSSTEIQSYHTSIDEELLEVLQKFWKLDEMPVTSIPSLSIEDQECEDHFKSTHTRDADGRYVVKIPLKKSTSLLGNSRNAAYKMFFRLSARMENDPNLKDAYTEFLREYESLTHMKRVSSSAIDQDSTAYYLPHHGVIRESSTTTKLRVVFNASSRSSTGVSLNDIVHTGAKLQTELIDVLIWFRHFRFVFTSDMEKMYRQIKVHPEDWNLQRILWSENPNEVDTFQLTTVTYGIACAPFLALRTVQQLIEDEGMKFPLATSTLIKGRYVDDIFGGADSTDEAQIIIQQVNGLCLAGGFTLKKWASNEPKILSQVPSEIQLFPESVPIDQRSTVHTLGMSWNPHSDTFGFSWIPPPQCTITKRTTLSTIAKLYDPMGFISPVVITGKIFIQDLWSLKRGWDDPLPPHLVEKWTQFEQHLQEINILSFPRWFGTSSQTPIEIHGFCDASQHALAAVVYIRCSDLNNDIRTTLVCAKTKVAPIKRLTIPRLELSAAVLITKLVKHLLQVLNYGNLPVHMWTDSAITYTWINNHPSRWKDFIYNRVAFIQETIPSATWHFIPGKENPADLATRGLSPAQLAQCSTWWTGPDWLQKSSESWPNKIDCKTSNEDLEERPVRANVATSAVPNHVWNLPSKYSNLTKLLRVTALCKRFVLCLRKKATSIIKTPLTTQELEETKLFWVLRVQQASFTKERKLLLRGDSVPQTHHLARLTPFMDSQELMRVGGRLKTSPLPYNIKHPIILPNDSPLTQLIISDAHQRNLHGGTQETLAFIKNNFWILGGRVPVSSFIGKCVRCARFRKIRAQQLMGQLPADRVTPSRAFLHSGVDYAGPFLLKTWKGRNARTYKAYIALFVCHSTSAIHLELVTDYSGDAFIAAYKRFTARRGICETLRSDCGTNLKGADSQLRELFSLASNQLGKLSSLLSNDGTQWLFNPPAAPHFGGKWEAGVKSVKHHLRRVLGNHLLTYEEMHTFLLQIEAVLNSRPLAPLTEDPDDLSALTPGHFLIGAPLTTVPEPSLEHLKVSRLTRWQLLRQMLDSFWTRWSRECLQRYQVIYKWNQPSPSIQKGALTLVIDERYPPSKWPLGRILEVHPGKDGHVRVVTVKTQTSVFKRPITKISLLPIEVDVL